MIIFKMNDCKRLIINITKIAIDSFKYLINTFMEIYKDGLDNYAS
jgi:hypothetical protein